MICATVTNFRPCCLAKASSCGRRAIVPSEFRISQITPAGISPAMRARSTDASVCPVLARSQALIPVVTPWLVTASTETMNAVPCGSVAWSPIDVRTSCSTRSGVRVRHTRPRPWVAMKLMVSGVIFSAAQTRVLAILVIGDNHHFAATYRLYCFFHQIELDLAHFLFTQSLYRQSNDRRSRVTGSPNPTVVSAGLQQHLYYRRSGLVSGRRTSRSCPLRG